MRHLVIMTLALAALAGCAANRSADYCSARLGSQVESAMAEAKSRLAQGCEYQFDGYFHELLALAEANPDTGHPQRFSDFLVAASESGVISQRQARNFYNRYFGIKFVSLQGDYNTCSQACPDRARVLSDMRSELQDKELGLLRASENQSAYYRADSLLKESELVLEATCMACQAGASR